MTRFISKMRYFCADAWEEWRHSLGVNLMALGTLVAALFVWRWPSLAELAWLAAIGGVGTCGHLCFIKAYTFADVSAVEPITFTLLIWAALIGYLAFAEFPDLWVWTGGGMIVAATSYLAHREAAARRTKK